MEWNKLVPELVVADYQHSKDFYQRLFGFTLRFERTEDNFGYFDLAGAQVMLLQAPGNELYALQRPGPNGKGLHFQVEVETIADLLERLQAANIDLHPPSPKPGTGRAASNTVSANSSSATPMAICSASSNISASARPVNQPGYSQTANR